MFLQAGDILNKPVFAEDEVVGKVLEILIDPQRGRSIGFLIAQPFAKPHAVSYSDILELSSSGVLINSIDSIIRPSEVLQIQRVISQGVRVLGAKAETESGKKLGRVLDFVIEAETGQVTKFYIKPGLFTPLLILSSDKVLRMEKNRIIFRNDVLERIKTTEVVPA